MATNLALGLPLAALTSVAGRVLQMIPFFGPFVSWAPPVIVALVLVPDARPARDHPDGRRLVRGHERAPAADHAGRGRHPPDRRPRLGPHRRRGSRASRARSSGSRSRPSSRRSSSSSCSGPRATGRSPGGRRAGVAQREGRPVRVPREPVPGSGHGHRRARPGRRRSRGRPRGRPARRPDMSDDARGDDQPDMTRERARTERRDLDKERGEPLAGGRCAAARGSCGRGERPLGDWSSRPRILVTNDDGVESRGLLALKQALEPIGEVTVVAPDTNQSAVGHQKTLMRPLRVRERTLGDGSLAYSVDGSPTDAVSLAFLGYFGHGFDLVASGINYGANLGDDITYSGTVSAAMEAVINNCPAFAISQEYYEHPDFALAGRAATTVARNILEHGLSPGELINVNVPAVPPDEFDGFEVTRLGKRVYQDELIERRRSARDPLLLDRRAAAVGARRRGHRFPRRRQPPDRGHADPSRPDRPAPAATPSNVGLDAARRDRRAARRPRGGTRGWTISRSWSASAGERRRDLRPPAVGGALAGDRRRGRPRRAARQAASRRARRRGRLLGIDRSEPAGRPATSSARRSGRTRSTSCRQGSGIDIGHAAADARRVPAPDHRHADARRERPEQRARPGCRRDGRSRRDARRAARRWCRRRRIDAGLDDLLGGLGGMLGPKGG